MEAVTPAVRLYWDESAEQRVVGHLEEFPAALEKRLDEPIRRITAEMLELVLAAEPYRTGALREATRSFVDITDSRMRGRVRVLARTAAEAIKAGSLEYGAHAAAHVSEHTMTLDHVFDKQIAPEEVMVAAYERDVNIDERRFLRDALAAVTHEFELEVQKAITALAASFFAPGGEK